nr:immunoglobulin heavy chain junction region [Macaca mulatta]MOX95088.1 immunoglobulin heavy chain junction region [Macaca mulatta]
CARYGYTDSVVIVASLYYFDYW